MIYDCTETLGARKRLGTRGQFSSELLPDATEGATVGTDSKAISTHHADRPGEDAPGPCSSFPPGQGSRGRLSVCAGPSFLMSCSRGLHLAFFWGCHCHANAFARLVDALRKRTRSL